MAEETTALVVAVFDSIQQATQAYNELRAAGFGDDYLGLFACEDQSVMPL